MNLKTLIPEIIWHAQQPLRIGPLRFTGRMTLIRLDDGSLWVHSPARPATELVRQIDALGPVRDVIAPNREHHLFLVPFLAAFPRARGWIAPGLGIGRSEFEHLQTLNEVNRRQWEPELRCTFIEGLPRLNETVWYHAATRSLIVTDLLLCFARDNPLLLRAAARLVARPGRPAIGRHVRLLVRDRAALARSVESILALDFDRLILAHDQVIERNARDAVESAFDWLLHHPRGR